MPSKISVATKATCEGSEVQSLFTDEKMLSCEQEVYVALPQPIAIHPDQPYEIKLEQQSSKELFNQMVLKKELELIDGIKIQFLSQGVGYEDSKFGLITKLRFKRA